MAYKFKGLKKMFADGGQVRSNDDIMESNLKHNLYNNEIPVPNDNYNDDEQHYDTQELIKEGKIGKDDVKKLFQKIKKSNPT